MLDIIVIDRMNICYQITCKKSKVKGGRNEKENFEQYESFKCRFVVTYGYFGNDNPVT